jgi:hypothetical protein
MRSFLAADARAFGRFVLHDSHHISFLEKNCGRMYYLQA